MNIKDFIKAFWAFGLAISVEKLIGFALVPLYTSYFNTSEYGVIDLIQTIVIIATIFGMIQMESALQRFFYDYSGNKRKLFITNIFLLVFVLSSLIGAIGVLIANFVSNSLLGSSEYSYALKVSFCQIPFINLSILGLIIIRFQKQNLRFILLILFKVFLTIIFVGLFVIYLSQGIEGVFNAQLLVSVLSAIAVLFVIRENFCQLKLNRHFLNEVIHYGLPLFPARIGSIANSYGNRFFLISYLSVSTIGIFSVSLKWASIVQFLYTCFVMAWNPFVFSRLKMPNFKKVFAQTLPLICCLLFCAVTFITCFSSEIIELLTPTEYFDAQKSLGILSLYYALFIVKEVVDIGPKAEKRTIYVSYNFVISTLVNIGLLFFLTPKYGLSGVCIGMLTSNLVLIAASWYTSNKLVYIPYDIKKFVLFLIPVLFLCISTLFVTPNILIRLGLFITICSFYLVCFYRLFYLYRSKMSG